MSEYILQMENVTKEFAGVKALDGVTLRVRRGEVHALTGENGAGKSTLMKILCAIYPHGSFEGQILLDDQEQKFLTVKDSEKAGIAIILQELALIKSLNICENIFLGNEITSNGRIQWNEQHKKTQELLRKVHLDIPSTTPVEELGAGQQQLIEIAKALHKRAKLLILDEPTSSLTDVDTRNLLQIIRELRKEGTTCIYISHKLQEVYEIADSVTVIRDGRVVTTQPIQEIAEKQIVSCMVGRELNDRFPRRTRTPGDVALELRHWSVPDQERKDRMLVEDVSLVARRGEIIGIAGLIGAGRTELALSLFGALRATTKSEMLLEGKPVKPVSPKDAIALGIGYVSEDRKRYGLILQESIRENMTLASLKKLSRRGAVNGYEEERHTLKNIEMLRIKTPSIEQTARNLSGGNQQKVVLGKWLMTEPKILILDEPTRGIDVGAKQEIYLEMNRLAEEGMSIVMISSELPEVLGISDRIYVMAGGRIQGELAYQNATQEKVMALAIGGKDHA